MQDYQTQQLAVVSTRRGRKTRKSCLGRDTLGSAAADGAAMFLSYDPTYVSLRVLYDPIDMLPHPFPTPGL